MHQAPGRLVPPPQLRDYSRRSCQRTDQQVFFGPGGPEGQKARHRREAEAKAVCARCPILAGCAAWALGDEDAWEQHGIWGGMTAAERERERKARKDAASAGAVQRWQRSQQRDHLLAVLAGHQAALWGLSLRRVGKVDAVLVAAGLDERTVSWQASRMCGLLRVERTATVRELLLAAAAAGVWTGTVLTAAPARPVAGVSARAWGAAEALTLPGIDMVPLVGVRRRARVRAHAGLRIVRAAGVCVEVLTLPGIDLPEEPVVPGRGRRTLAAAA